MKAKYIAPQIVQVTIQTKYLISTSTVEQSVYTDDAQTTSSALTRKSNNIWDEEW